MLMCSEPGCKNPADYTYTWPWGETGHCCAAHQMVIHQKAANLDRTGQVSFAPVREPGPAPVTRDERTRLIAEKLSAEGEMNEVKRANTELVALNQQMSHELRLARSRVLELDTQIKDAKADVAQATQERDESAAKLHDALAEVKRLELILAYTPNAQPAKDSNATPWRK